MGVSPRFLSEINDAVRREQFVRFQYKSGLVVEGVPLDVVRYHTEDIGAIDYVMIRIYDADGCRLSAVYLHQIRRIELLKKHNRE